MKRLYSISVFIAFSCSVFGQDTTLLPTIDLSVKSIDLKDVGNSHQKIDSSILHSYLGQSMANVLQLETSVFIKSYGVSSLQSISFKGTSASHTNVVWNGIPLNNLNNGITDFGLIPILSNSETALISGASGTRFGSSSVGGTVIIQSDPNTTNEIRILNGLGSYGLSISDFSISQKLGKWHFNSGFTWNQASNNFEFENTRRLGFPTQILENASYQNWKQCNTISYQINRNQQILLNTWVFSSHREIPGGMASMPNFAQQKDKGTKLSLQWNIKSNKHKAKLNTNLFYSDDDLNYQDKEVNLISNAYTRLLGFSQNLEKKIGNNKRYYLAASLQHQGQKLLGQSDAFNQKEELLYAGYGALSAHLLPQGVKIQARLRAEKRSTTEVPLIPAAGLEWKTKWFKLFANTGKHFRVPTFNDKYWSPGGNPNLLPESGRNIDIGLTRQFLKNSLQATLSGYHLSVNNWIQWVPSNQGYWSPQNVHTVNSKGLDLDLQWATPFAKSLIVLHSQTSINSAVNVETDKQLMYTPKFQEKASIEIRLPKNFGIRWTANFTGIRYTTNDHSRQLPGQHLHNVHLSWSNIDRHKLILSLNCNNLFDIQFEGVEGQVQMRRQYLLKIQFNLNTKNNEKHH